MRALRDIDPSEQVGHLALQAMQPGDTLFVAPQYMSIAVAPFLPVPGAPPILTLGALPLPKPTRGVALMRGVLEEIDETGHKLADWDAIAASGNRLHDIFVYISENDDVILQDEARQMLLAQLDRLMGPCQMLQP